MEEATQVDHLLKARQRVRMQETTRAEIYDHLPRALQILTNMNPTKTALQKCIPNLGSLLNLLDVIFHLEEILQTEPSAHICHIYERPDESMRSSLITDQD